jgi:DNA-binding transcriptional ArsR family regulator
MCPRQADGQMTIHWDVGAAYDFFLSLTVLKQPKVFEVRSTWASGMRARLESSDRESLDAGTLSFGTPGKWIHSLPQPKTVENVLTALAQVPAGSRLALLSGCPSSEGAQTADQKLLVSISKAGMWSEDDVAALKGLKASGRKERQSALSTQDATTILGTWADAEAFGDRYLRALRNYYDVFFREEERRIEPKLVQALERAQERSSKLTSVELIEEISQGIRYESTSKFGELTLVPSFWVSPLVQIHPIGAGHQLWLFGARPVEDSLVPGEPVPDALRVALKALADPTRLRILRYVHCEPLTVADLAKRLRLRMPTVIHHLQALRLAGLVYIHVESKLEGSRRRFGARTEGLEGTLESLRTFLGTD